MQGMAIRTNSAAQARVVSEQLQELLRGWGLSDASTVHSTEPLAGHPGWQVRATLTEPAFLAWTPEFDTLGLSARLGLDVAHRAHELELKIAIEMLAAPRLLSHPSLEEWRSAIRMRSAIVDAARHARVAFATTNAERPTQFWNWDEDMGWRLNPGVDLVEALEHTIQPGPNGPLWSFSCYRVTEHVLLLGLARELRVISPKLYEALQHSCRHEAIRSEAFVGAFLEEFGSTAAPLPVGYYLPGDRVWFRNPDERSSNVTGYEGSWVIYLGGGLFSNFWKDQAPYTLQDKCIEIFHWRDAVVNAHSDDPTMDEDLVEKLVQQTRHDPHREAAILARMLRWRDPQGVYAQGGCLDRSREHLRRVHPGTADLEIPLHVAAANRRPPPMLT